jgi:hypothetical protein
MSTIKTKAAPPTDDKTDIVVDPVLGLHYQLVAYVGATALIPAPFDGAATFTTIMQQRPDGCRYAVGRRYALRAVKVPGSKDQFTAITDTEPSGSFVVWDLHDEDLVRGRRTGQGGLIMPPRPVIIGETEDGTVMKAMMLFDR